MTQLVGYTRCVTLQCKKQLGHMHSAAVEDEAKHQREVSEARDQLRVASEASIELKELNEDLHRQLEQRIMHPGSPSLGMPSSASVLKIKWNVFWIL